jgi:hypothetical protein
MNIEIQRQTFGKFDLIFVGKFREETEVLK